ncbi:MAG: prolipoprotein diacylglyceryl transferase [Planctomycetota bacterium]
MWPVLWRIPLPFGLPAIPLHSFGVMIALGFLAASALGTRYVRRFSAEPEEDARKLNDLSVWVLFGAILGARLLYVFVHPEEFEGRWIEVLFLWKGGLVFYGGFLAAVAVGLWRVRRLGMDLWNTADLCLAAGWLGLGIGRIGCLLVGDDYGSLAPEGTPFPIAIRVPDPIPPDAQWDSESAGRLVYATQLYLSANGFLLAGLARWMLPRRRFRGQVVWTSTALYCVTRSAIECLRGDDVARGVLDLPEGFPLLRGLSTSQAISIPLFLLSLYMLRRLRRRGEGPPQP